MKFLLKDTIKLHVVEITYLEKPQINILYMSVVFGEAKLCKFDGHYYCYECHLDEERLIPARILMNWDFRKHHVCVRSSEFLESIETMPVLNVEETNGVLYHYIPELEQTRVSN